MIETSKTTKDLKEAVFNVQSKAPVIRKKADNPYFKSKYAEYPEIQAEIKPLLIENNLLTQFMPVEGDKLVMLVTHVKSQEFEKISMDLHLTQTNPQAQGSAITYGKRYMFTAYYDLQIEDALDDDGNAASGKTEAPQHTVQTATAQQQAKPKLEPQMPVWINVVRKIQNKKTTVELIAKEFFLTKGNAKKLIEEAEKPKPTLKPGSPDWDFMVDFLNTPDGKMSKVIYRYEISDQDKEDLLIDAQNKLSETTNETPAA